MINNVSTYFCSSSNPNSAIFMRLAPSNWNGFVTTPTVRIPNSLAALAITGAAPVPVPPPRPAVINTIFASRICEIISSKDSSAAACPIFGLAPAPKPCVIFTPIWIRRSDLESASACASELATRNSTPSSPDWIILFTALPPAPPTPMTVMRGFNSDSIEPDGNVRLILIIFSNSKSFSIRTFNFFL